jgi:hypothetical protein
MQIRWTVPTNLRPDGSVEPSPELIDIPKLAFPNDQWIPTLFLE